MNLYAEIYCKIRYVIIVMISKSTKPKRIENNRLSAFFFLAGPNECLAGAGDGDGDGEGVGRL